MKSPHVTVIVLNWKSKKLLEENLSSVIDQDYPNYTILLVDNGSDDESLEYIRLLSQENENIEKLELDKNYGYAGGNNRAVKTVLEEGKSDYVVFLNTDVRVEEKWLSNLINGFTSEDIGLVTSNVRLYYPYVKLSIKTTNTTKVNRLTFRSNNYYQLKFPQGFNMVGQFLSTPYRVTGDKPLSVAIPSSNSNKMETLEYDIDGTIIVSIGKKEYHLSGKGNIKVLNNNGFITQNAGTDFIEYRKVFKDRHIFEFEKTLESEIVDASCGCAMAVRCDLLDKYGSFNEKYFMYWEDSELSFRFNIMGYKSKFVANAICYHIFWGSSGNKETKTHIYYGHRNRLFFIKKYFGMYQFIYHWARSFAKMIIWGIKSLSNDEVSKLQFVNRFRALRDAIFMKS